MMTRRRPTRALLCLTALLALLALPGVAMAAKEQPPTAQPPEATAPGSLQQLPGRLGCVADGPAAKKACGPARALKGPGPFMGSHAIAVSPDGKNVYVASGGSDAIAVFTREAPTGALAQPKGKAGCVAVKAARGCGLAVGLIAPNSVAVSRDGRNVYATARDGAALLTFHRNPRTGALAQLPPSASGCISALPIPGCTPGRALKGPDVVALSPDGKNVYVGDFFGNAVSTFSRAAGSGALTQLPGTEGCIADGGGEGCAGGVALGSIEGLTVSPKGSAVYAAAAVSNAIDILARNSTTGALSQANATGCISNSPLTGCTQGYELAGANAVAVSQRGGDVYATSLFSNSVTTFHPSESGVGLTQPVRVLGENTPPGLGSPAGCLVWLRAPGCSFGVAMHAPEGVAVSPDGESVYVVAYETGAIDILDRNTESGTVTQKPGERGCLSSKSTPDCARGRALAGAGSVVVSPDGRNVYSTAQKSNAVDVFRRIE
jgi:DNA-binding beta-propeller fold protein YncE